MRWTIKSDPDPKKVNELVNILSVDNLIAKLLLQRKIESYDEAKHFFRPSLDDLHDPFLMKDMDLAIDRIEKAFKNEESNSWQRPQTSAARPEHLLTPWANCSPARSLFAIYQPCFPHGIMEWWNNGMM